MYAVMVPVLFLIGQIEMYNNLGYAQPTAAGSVPSIEDQLSMAQSKVDQAENASKLIGNPTPTSEDLIQTMIQST